MINVGDLVKITGKTIVGPEEKEAIPIGTICKVVSIDLEGYIECIPINEVSHSNSGFFYNTDDVEQGMIYWAPKVGDSYDCTEIPKPVLDMNNIARLDTNDIHVECDDYQKTLAMLIANKTKEITK